MTFPLAIKIHRAALLRLVAMLFEASGLGPGKSTMLPRIIRGSVLFTLRPAESAVRRLIAVLESALAVPQVSSRAAPRQPIPKGSGERAPVFALFDPRRRVGERTALTYAKHAPGIFFFDDRDPPRNTEETAATPSRDAPVDAAGLLRRLLALKGALEDLPKQARRLARLKAVRAKAGKRALRVVRPGRPPGHRARGRYEIDDILRECHQLALMAMAAPDTS